MARALVLTLLAAALLFALGDGRRPEPAAPAADVVPTDCRISFAEAERLSGRLSLRRHHRVRRVHPAGPFRDGAVTAQFAAPRRVEGRPGVGVSARGFQAVATIARDRSVTLALHHGLQVLSERALTFRARAGRQFRVRLRLDGSTARAKAWPVTGRQPRWQTGATAGTTVDTGRAAVVGRLSGGRQVKVRFAGARVTTTRARGSVGVYTGMFEYERALEYFGAYPAVTSSYYQPHQVVNVEQETARVLRGISPSITITTKGTDTIEVLGTGPSHPRYPEAEAWLDRYVAGLTEIASLDVHVPVYATLEHEYKMKVATGQLTGRSADPRYYGRALRLFFEKARAASPALRVTYWIVADNFDRRIDRVAARSLTTPPDTIVFDPYVARAGASLPTITKADLDWIRARPWYVGQEIALGEFGMPVRFGDEGLAQFLSDVHSSMRAQGLSWGVFFNRSRDLDTQIIGRADGKRFPKAVAAFRSSTDSSAAC